MTTSVTTTRDDILAYILEKTRGAFFVPAAEAGQMIDGRHIQTTYRQIENNRFPLPVVQFGRNWVVRVHDLAELLTTGSCTSLTPVRLEPKRLPGRPPKCSAEARAKAARAKSERAKKKAAKLGVAGVTAGAA